MSVSVFSIVIGVSLLQEQKWVVLIPLATLLASGLWSAVMSLGFTSRANDEERAGYTTYHVGRPHLPMVDDKTGIVIREAGAPLLTRAEASAARKAAQDAEGPSQS